MSETDDKKQDENVAYISDLDGADDNVIQSFELVSSNLRGRVVRLGSVLDQILGAHDYPDQISQILAEIVTMAAALSSMLKYDGIFTLQIQGDGPLSLAVADLTCQSDIRGYAMYDEEAFEALDSPSFRDLVGKGYLAFTVDQGDSAERYQGIVELRDGGIADSVQNYFNQSEQIGTGLMMRTQRVGEQGNWRSGAIMLQHIPGEEQNPEAGVGNIIEDNWRRAMVLMQSCKDNELLDPQLHSNVLLRRLFHEEGIRVYEPTELVWKCRCSKDRVLGALSSISAQELEVMDKEDGGIHVVCEYCSEAYSFKAVDVISNKEKL